MGGNPFRPPSARPPTGVRINLEPEQPTRGCRVGDPIMTSKVLNIRKTLRLEKQLVRSFPDVPQLTIKLNHVDNHSIHVTACYEGSAEHQCLEGTPHHTALYKSENVHPNDLYRQALHPLDHWVDIMVQRDKLAQEGKL